MTLLELINEQQYASLANAGDVDGLLSALNTPSIEKVDHTPIGPAGLLQRLPAEVVDAAAQSFEAASQASATMRMLLGTFQSYGFDFADPVTRGNIDALVAGGMPSQVGTALKSLGISQVSPATNAGLGTITQEQVEAALEARRIASLVAWIQGRASVTIDAAVAGSLPDNDAAIAFFGGA